MIRGRERESLGEAYVIPISPYYLIITPAQLPKPVAVSFVFSSDLFFFLIPLASARHPEEETVHQFAQLVDKVYQRRGKRFGGIREVNCWWCRRPCCQPEYILLCQRAWKPGVLENRLMEEEEEVGYLEGGGAV